MVEANLYESADNVFNLEELFSDCSNEQLTAEELERSRSLFPECPYHCNRGRVFDRYNKFQSCPYCSEQRRKIVNGTRSFDADGRTFSEALNLPEYLRGVRYDNESLFLGVKDMATPESVERFGNIVDAILKTYRRGELPPYSCVFALPYNVLIGDFVVPLMSEAYKAGFNVAPFITSNNLCKLRAEVASKKEAKYFGGIFDDYIKADVCVVFIDGGTTQAEAWCIHGLMAQRAMGNKATFIVTQRQNFWDFKFLLTHKPAKQQALWVAPSFDNVDKAIDMYYDEVRKADVPIIVPRRDCEDAEGSDTVIYADEVDYIRGIPKQRMQGEPLPRKEAIAAAKQREEEEKRKKEEERKVQEDKEKKQLEEAQRKEQEEHNEEATEADILAMFPDCAYAPISKTETLDSTTKTDEPTVAVVEDKADEPRVATEDDKVEGIAVTDKGTVSDDEELPRMSDEALYASLRVVFVDGKPYIPENNTKYVANSAYDFGEEEVNAEEEDELYDETKFYGITGLATVLKVSRTVIQSLPLDTVPYMYKKRGVQYFKCYFLAGVEALYEASKAGTQQVDTQETVVATDKAEIADISEIMDVAEPEVTEPEVTEPEVVKSDISEEEYAGYATISQLAAYFVIVAQRLYTLHLSDKVTDVKTGKDATGKPIIAYSIKQVREILNKERHMNFVENLAGYDSEIVSATILNKVFKYKSVGIIHRKFIAVPCAVENGCRYYPVSEIKPLLTANEVKLLDKVLSQDRATDSTSNTIKSTVKSKTKGTTKRANKSTSKRAKRKTRRKK